MSPKSRFNHDDQTFVGLKSTGMKLKRDIERERCQERERKEEERKGKDE